MPTTASAGVVGGTLPATPVRKELPTDTTSLDPLDPVHLAHPVDAVAAALVG